MHPPNGGVCLNEAMNKAFAFAVFASLALAACAPPVAAPDEQEQAAAQSAQRAAAAAQPATNATSLASANAGSCDATQAQWVVGKPVAEADAEQARQDAGAANVRVIKPGMPVTMDFNASRLDIEVDGKNVGVGARCG